MPHRRAWLPHVVEAVLNALGALLLLGVGVYYDHQRMPPGWITVAAIGLLAGPKLRDAARAFGRERRAEQPELLPEVQAALRISDLMRERGAAAVLLELEAAVDRRALPRGGGDGHVDG